MDACILYPGVLKWSCPNNDNQTTAFPDAMPRPRFARASEIAIIFWLLTRTAICCDQFLDPICIFWVLLVADEWVPCLLHLYQVLKGRSVPLFRPETQQVPEYRAQNWVLEQAHNQNYGDLRVCHQHLLRRVNVNVRPSVLILDFECHFQLVFLRRVCDIDSR